MNTNKIFNKTNISVIVLVIFVFIILFFLPKEKKEKETATDFPPKQIADEMKKDTDGDGFPDWEETLYGTDPNTPNKSLPQIKNGQIIKIEEQDPPLSPNTFVPSKIDSQNPDTYPNNQIKNQDQNLLKEVGNNFGRVLKNYKNLETEFEIFDKAIKEITPEIWADLNQIGEDRINLSKELLSVSMNFQDRKEVKEFVYAERALGEAIQTLIGNDQNIKTIPAERFETYGKMAMANANAVVALMQMFQRENIIFSPKEDGYIFSIPS